MPTQGNWLPRVLGVTAGLLAGVYLLSCALISPSAGDQVAFGYRFTGIAGWIVCALHAAFFTWLAYVAWRRRPAAAWGVIAYCVYLIETIWIYSTGPGSSEFPNGLPLLLMNTAITAALLSFCRLVLKWRDAFSG